MKKLFDSLLYKISGYLPTRIIKRDGISPYIERYYIGQLFGFTFYLHRFLSSDGDTEVHDHPWKMNFSFILLGGYEEEVFDGFSVSEGWCRATKKRRFVNALSHKTFHRITHIKPYTWTLFIHSSSRHKEWGFLKKTKFPTATMWIPHTTPTDFEWYKSAPIGKESAREPIRIGRIYWAHFENYKVFLDGKEVEHALEADDLIGEVKTAKLTPHGIPSIKGDKLETKWEYGNVQIKKI